MPQQHSTRKRGGQSDIQLFQLSHIRRLFVKQLSHSHASQEVRGHPAEMVRLACTKCGRSGQYRKQKLIERYGADIRLPDLREEIARCERHGQMHDACMVSYVELKSK